MSTVEACDKIQAPDLRIPKVFLIGAAKAGTTFLSSLIWQHPEVHVAKPKEPRVFFVR